MNPEQLESLLIDRELGELPPAVVALLEAHLAQDPSAARQAADIQATLQLTRRAAARPSAPPQRPFDFAEVRRAHDRARAATLRTELYRLAACLALGLGVGWFARPSPAPAIAAEHPSPHPVALALEAPGEPRSTFWSVARLTASHRLAPTAGALRHTNP
jgi:anti-sigma factor RsiW